MPHHAKDLLALAKAVIDTEIAALAALPARLDNGFLHACEAILACRGRVIVTGMGKSGHIGNKIAATLASTGTPAFFLHPGEASHGDLGMIVSGDVIIALSNSGTSEEILSILPAIRRLDVRIIAMTGNSGSPLAKAADFHIHTGVDREACPLGLAPTSSTTATLVMGDALAIALLEARGFTVEDFARSHPGGRLGKRLLVHVRDIMHTGEEIPQVRPDVNLQQAILEMTRKKLGMTAITDTAGTLLGIFTDGDLRRSFEKGRKVQEQPIAALMTHNCRSIDGDSLAVEALNLMQKHAITVLPVVQDNRVIGIIHMHDLLRAGIT
ncbi:KpsF/GutQ family sugar-phosphate isomerase [Candidatus Thiothrix sp. Deng01]|uniref:Arabinose 5-phosphate isomerase n=1 Tax=Candidatus Thiothrix phosphatis TaxID=3112415 RepID=A0ABU6D1M7_9GAMM|nr:KpsF/GutQ family sugar-phosphate isomerase [Candidatus Thiothrix sp. Deng01]MEB4592282.1 KpsF/GutQ family sugar-phosphate isomerase [Candidatus Thiothrix sp. Deng01]